MGTNVGRAMVGICFIFAAFSILPTALIFTNDHVFEGMWGWIAFVYSVLIINLIPLGFWLSRGIEYIISPIEVLVCLAINWLLALLMLDMGLVSYATNCSLIPYLALVAIVLARRWNRLTKFDEFLLSWSWMPLMLYVMPLIYRLRAGKEVW